MAWLKNVGCDGLNPFNPSFYIFVIVYWFFVFVEISNPAFGQTSNQTPTVVIQTTSGLIYADVDYTSLKMMGFEEATAKNLVPILKNVLNLNDDQIVEIQNFRSLSQVVGKLAYFDDYFNSINENSNDAKRTVEPDKVKNNKQALTERTQECLKETERLKKNLGNKFDELCLWCNELRIIQMDLLTSIQTNRDIEDEDFADKTWIKFQSRNEYQALKKIIAKPISMKSNFSIGVDSHKNIFKLLAKYEYYMQNPRGNKNKALRKETEDKKNQTIKSLIELKN